MNAYTFFLLTGFAASLIYLKKQISPKEFPRLSVCVWVGFLAGLTGAKALFAIFHPDLSLLDGGMIFYGGLLFGVPVFTLCLWLNKKHLNLDRSLKASLPALALGHAIGRVGCFFAGCCYGHLLQEPIHLPGLYGELQYFPIQLVEAAGLFVLFVSLHKSSQKRFLFTLSLYGSGYGLIRTLCEWSRSDPSRSLIPWGSESIAFTQVFSWLLLGASLSALAALLFWRQSREFSAPSSPQRS